MPQPKKKTKGTPDSTDLHVGKQLRVRRTVLDLSQEKLAEMIGLTFQQIQKYERGMNRISAGRLWQFANILDVPVTYFYKGLDSKRANDPARDGIEERMFTKENMIFLRDVESLPEPAASALRVFVAETSNY